MTQQIGGHCGKCGAPYYVPSVWHGIVPPTPTPTCNCWNTTKVVTTTFTAPTQTRGNCTQETISDGNNLIINLT